MFKKILVSAILALSFSLVSGRAAVQAPTAASEDNKTRLDKKEIVDLMQATGRMPRAQQDSRMAQIHKNQADSKTPRSDFEFCMGLAHLGNYQAQVCVARAYERGLGIIEDLTDAYVWYALALENPIEDAPARKSLEEEKERLTLKLRSIYPSPSDEELEELVNAEKNRLAEYKKQISKTRK